MEELDPPAILVSPPRRIFTKFDFVFVFFLEEDSLLSPRYQRLHYRALPSSFVFFLVDSLFVSFSFPPASVSSSFVVPLIRADWRAIIKKLKQKQNRSVIFLQPNAPVQWPSFRKPWRISSIFMNYRRIMSNQSISNREIHYRNIMSKKNKESRRETQIEFDDQWKVAMIRPISVAI